jgi:homoserine kinase type II
MDQLAHLSSSRTEERVRESFAADELAIVLSHYNLGRIEQISEFPRGSRRAPKLVLKTENGAYLLKRRAKGKDDPFKVAFCHQLQLYLAAKQFPLPHLIGTADDNNSMLQWRGAIYELFEFIKGTPYDQSLESTAESGRILGLFHKLLSDYEPQYEPPRGSYHAARSVNKALSYIPGTLRKLDAAGRKVDLEPMEQTLQFLTTLYNEAAMRVNDLGLNDWTQLIVHSDWHPGNTLYRGQRVVAVIDYDAARMQQRIVDVANGALQFSIIGGGDDPSQWPEYLDESRYKRFLRGYDSVYATSPELMLSVVEVQTIPWLMIEALIAEAVIPIANTGSFAKLEGAEFLKMVARKTAWIRDHSARLIAALEG